MMHAGFLARDCTSDLSARSFRSVHGAAAREARPPQMADEMEPTAPRQTLTP